MNISVEDFTRLEAGRDAASKSQSYAWRVFALTSLLMISDYASRQVIVAIFPNLKAEWSLSDLQLGSLASIVALMVGLTTFPISLFVDRWGRVKGITAMACVWSVSTVACGFTGSYAQMLTACALVGLGEAGYGSAGASILAYTFPPKRRSTVLGGFFSAGIIGSVLGVVLGGILARRLGWQGALIAVGAAGLLIAVLYPFLVRDYRTVSLIKRAGDSAAGNRMDLRDIAKELFGTVSMNFTYAGSGLQVLVLSTIMAWVPSFLHRFYGLTPEKAAIEGSVIILLGGVGMTCGGLVVDRLSQKSHKNRLRVPALFALLTTALLVTAFSLPSGTPQLVLIALGSLLAGAHVGPSTAVAATLMHPGLRTTSMATLALANNLLGLAPGPFLVGALSDWYGLKTALALTSLAGIGACICFLLGARRYEDDLRQKSVQ